MENSNRNPMPLFYLNDLVSHKSAQYMPIKMLIIGVACMDYADGTSSWLYQVSYQTNDGSIHRPIVMESELEAYQNK